jgi:hypothetical protein
LKPEKSLPSAMAALARINIGFFCAGSMACTSVVFKGISPFYGFMKMYI